LDLFVDSQALHLRESARDTIASTFRLSHAVSCVSHRVGPSVYATGLTPQLTSQPSELIGSVNLVFAVQLVGFRRLWFGLGRVSGWFGSDLLVSNGKLMPNGVIVPHNRTNS
jgi:hypothetical protein